MKMNFCSLSILKHTMQLTASILDMIEHMTCVVLKAHTDCNKKVIQSENLMFETFFRINAILLFHIG